MPILPVEPLPPPFDPTSLLIDIVGAIAQLLGLGRQDLTPITDAINSTWNNFIAASSFLDGALTDIFRFARKLLGTLVDGLSHIITDILHGHLKQMIQDILNLLHKLHDIVAPLIAWLRRLQAIQRQYQLQALKRIINVIQRARQFLVVLKLLHVKWAQRLDGWLLQVEGKLISHVFALFQKQNEVIGWINWILDPTAMVRATPYFGTFARGMKAVWGAAQAIGLGKLLPQLAPGHGTAPPTKTFVDFYGSSHVGLASGAGYFGETQGVVLFVRDAIRADAGGAQG